MHKLLSTPISKLQDSTAHLTLAGLAFLFASYPGVFWQPLALSQNDIEEGQEALHEAL